jgi:hypothetical protein
VFVVLGLGFGEGGYALLKTIPDAVLGGLLLFSGIELAPSSKLHEHYGGDLFLVLLMTAIGGRPQSRGGIRSRIGGRLRPQTRVDQSLTTHPSHRAGDVS